MPAPSAPASVFLGLCPDVVCLREISGIYLAAGDRVYRFPAPDFAMISAPFAPADALAATSRWPEIFQIFETQEDAQSTYDRQEISFDDGRLP
ncbi:MAG TPA: hypothetical protein VLH09_06875 [Bryobacteraceae bacterium]|nr:hypothetical protein [Bryobacteraceae bacterium]